MTRMVRAALIIGTIAWFSPSHDQPAAERLEAARALPAQAAASSVAHAPMEALLASEQGRRLAAQAAAGMAEAALGRQR